MLINCLCVRLYQACQRTVKTFKAFILDEEPLEPLKCLFGPLSAFISTLEPLFPTFCQKKFALSWFRTEF